MQRNPLARSKPVAALALVACATACNGFVVSLGTDDGGTHTVGDGTAAHLPDTGAPVGADGGLDAPATDGGQIPDAHEGGLDAGGPGSDASAPECPSAAPAVGATCKDIGEECEYGSSVATTCNKIYKCAATGWETETNATACPTSNCPASYGAVDVSATCTPSGATCGYSQGTCTCAPPTPTTTPSKPDEWQCFPKQAGCPSPRPKLGSPCTASTATSCNYGACADGVELICHGGIWVADDVACPT